MIAHTSFEVISPNQTLILAPFDETHLADVLPVHMRVIAKLSAESKPFFTTHDPRFLLEEEELLRDGTSWGIFAPAVIRSATSPAAFLGIISLYHDTTPEGKSTNLIQEVSTVLLREEYKRKGLGTLAKLAVSQYAFAEGAHVLRAETATRNIAAQRSLVKAGFTRLDVAKDPVELADGTACPLEYWWLMNDDALAHSTQEARYEELVLGWQAYQHASAYVQMQPLSSER